MTTTHHTSTGPAASSEVNAGPLAAFVQPRAIAVVGASADPTKAGGAMIRSLDCYDGPVHPVNPRATEILGRSAAATLADIDGPVDLAVVAVPPPVVPQVLRDCADAGVSAAIVCAGGFAESGPDGERLQHEVADIVAASGLRLLGPNTSGLLVPAHRLFATFMPGVADLPAGGLAIVAQSGGVNLASAFLAARLGVGISLAVGLGNAVDVDTVDVLDHAAADHRTTAIALHIEGVDDGAALMAAVERASAIKPVVALKVGRADVSEFARSHTGALAGDWAVAAAALEQAGAVVVDSLTDLVEVAAALSVRRLPAAADPGIGVVTGQAGPGLIVADHLATTGVRLPSLATPTTNRLAGLLPPLTYQQNPVDTGRPDASFMEVMRTVSADPAIDALLVYALQEPVTSDIAEALADRVRRGELPPVVMATDGPAAAVTAQRATLHDAGVPVVRAPDRAATVLAAMVTDARRQHRRGRTGGEPAVEIPVARLSGAGALDEDAGKTLLGQLGIATPPRRVCDTVEQARQAWRDLPGPLVVKILDAEITHKAAAGGVRLGVRTEDELLDALNTTAAASQRPRWLLEQQVEPGIEVIVGGTRDAAFGPMVLVGAGGTGVEWGPAPVLRPAPLSSADADELVSGLPPALLLDLRPDRRSELAAVAHTISWLLAGHPEITELDINPLRVTAAGLIALDAVIVVDESTSGRDTNTRPPS
ncbi:acetate--CoA ligase family protein [Phytoactinopolyspora limicola]|uniref:acetate--CoA ligase family protein n=1 Tax=Phytoactinopolyspora limicola TaxID=2715536 RepID=UPI00140B8B73|nr:acetate--CoA ligase family protein [Phytoactinopolyspora limicola]